MSIKENTVSAVNQMKNYSDRYVLGEQNAPERILILGNSITLHAPNETIGWRGAWGMAASAENKDYVHRLYEKLKTIRRNICIRVRQCSFWERNFKQEDILSRYQEERDFQADIVVFRLGENVAEEDKPYFEEAFSKLVSFVCSKEKRAVFTTCWWWNESVDEAIERVAKQRGERVYNITFSADEKMKAIGLFEHSGVAAHPGDLGMEAIAQTIFESIL